MKSKSCNSYFGKNLNYIVVNHIQINTKLEGTVSALGYPLACSFVTARISILIFIKSLYPINITP